MQYNIWFNVCALIILVELLVLYYMKFNAPFKKYSIFLCLLWCALLSTVTSICNNTLPGIAPVWTIRLSNTVYFLAHGMITPALFLYVHSLTDYNLRDWKRLLPWLLPSIFAQLLVLTGAFSNTIFWLDSAGGYHRGPLLPLLYGITAYNFGAISFLLYRSRKLVPKGERISILIFLTMAGSSVVYQLIHPTMLVENFISATCLMISQLTVQNPEIILDGPSGILNKQGFAMLLSPQFEREHSFQVGFLVVDNYHELEKSYGFERVESRMRIVSDYLKQHPGCIYARMDNRVFCFVADNFQSGDAWENLFRDLEGDRLLRYFRSEGMGLRLRVKYGVLSCPEDTDSFGGLMELIDVAIKLEKDGDVIRLSTADVLKLRRRKQLEELVTNAVDGNMLHLVYQPVYCTEGKRFCSAEALLRMNTEKFGNVPPAEFITIAEETGTIVQMTQFVIESVCRFILSSRMRELELRRIHVNLSAVDCMQSDLAGRILETMARYGVPASMISVEITETAFSAMPDSILDNLKVLSDAGISVMLDDYGTGYSNLNRLMSAPLDVVKLDKSLVDNILVSENARIILNSTIRMMRQLNKKVLVEGVETKEQADYLREQGVNYIQGYYYAKPMDGSHLEKIFREQMPEETGCKTGV